MQEKPEGVYRGEGEPPKEKISNQKIAYVFPGQASQAVGMGRELYERSTATREVFDEADDALGFRLSKLIFEGPESELKDTINSQPAIMTVSIAALAALKENLGDRMPRPLFVAGHSLGQYTSAVAADVIDFRNGVRLVRERGRLMQQASEKQPGGMAAILGLDEVVLETICIETGVEIANINSPGQIVISGEKIALDRAIELAHQREARRTIALDVSGAFHSALMSSAQEGLIQTLSELNFKDPQVPIVANSNCAILTTGEHVKEELVKGLCSPVLWKGSVERMAEAGTTHFIELGPGKVLSGLIKQIDKKAKTFNIDSPTSLQNLASDWFLV